MFRMDLSQIPLFAMLRGRMGYLSQRQQIVAQNVANSDTPRFQPKDLKPFSFDAQMKKQAPSGASVTHPAHIPLDRSQGGLTSGWNAVVERDSETTLDGNSVVLEEQMLKLSDARMNYDAAIGFYQKSIGLLRTAVRTPGR